MTVKSYRARTMQEALALVRAELGPQAALLSTRELPGTQDQGLGTDGPRFEVVASDDCSSADSPLLRPPIVPGSPAGIDLTSLQRDARHTGEAKDRTVEVVAPAVPMIVVAGGLRGVGTTTASWAIAQALTRQGRRAVWVDADLTGGGEPRSTQRDTSATILDVLCGRHSLHEVLNRGPSGLQVIQGARPSTANQPWPPTAGTRFIQKLGQLAPHADVVVVDAGNQPDGVAQSFWQSASLLCLVVSPADEAILRTYSALKESCAWRRPARVQAVINRDCGATAPEIHARFAEACRRFLGLELLAGMHLPDDREPQVTDEASDAVWRTLEEAAQHTELYAGSVSFGARLQSTLA